ncbi:MULTISPECIES: hypothetical protein [unclassified Beijerinckia]|uniref:hypothetical protein n=1 Tax=unclassified Beijerinckia TaxID=2638183 RepID=UPI0008978912|nr:MULTISPECIES: hypothetical protein [unclassified Beijerinckia]MDH7796259.1 hypothetical protein [Beijerinckia sp. GAS462]SEC37312.1 hypothetical protein SAMN05443249_2542 [Beijerinckia sp. 28-YEA-48]
MKKSVLAACLSLCTTAALACDDARLERLLRQPLPNRANAQFEASRMQSSEGAIWKIYVARGKRVLRQVVRRDGAEGGWAETRLLIVTPSHYAITRTQATFSAPYAIPGSRVIREVKDIYVYCDGKLALPKDVDISGYVAAAAQAKSIFTAPEVASYVSVLKR